MNREYNAELKKIEAHLLPLLPSSPLSSWCSLVFPELDLKPDLAEHLLAPGRDLFARGGKRWRPLLAHLVCRTLGGGDAVLPLLPLVEFSHNASLIHDDLEDNSAERRGKPSVHLLYGEDTAINSGSFLYFLPLAALENWKGDAEDKNRLWKLWAEHLRFLHLGQSMDIAWHRDISFFPSLDDYMLMCRLKTGALAGFAALLGAEAAYFSGNNNIHGSKNYEEQKAHLGQAAQKLGVGFQILDDVKNLKTGIPGKKRGDDVAEGKKSLPLLLYLQKAETQEGQAGKMEKEKRISLVKRCFTAAKEGGTLVPEVEEFIQALTEAGALEEAEKKGKILIEEAGLAFSLPEAADSEAGQLLSGLSELLLHA